MDREVKMREFIALLDQAVIAAKELRRQIEEIDRILEERHAALKQAA